MQSGRQPVVDVALQGTGLSTVSRVDRAKVLQRLRLNDAAFRHLTRGAAITVLAILGGIIISLIYGSSLAFHKFGLSFLYEEVWNPVTEQFGAIAPIYGTVVTSIIAMLIAVPVGLFIALFLTELCSVRQRTAALDPVRRSALRHRRSHRRPHSRDHGAALYHFDLSRRV
jgi:phosphate transport system permease protein